MPGRLNASMATKCMDQMPPPSANAAVSNQRLLARPAEVAMRRARLRPVNDAITAMTSEKLTRIGSEVPVIAIAGQSNSASFVSISQGAE